MAFPISLTFLLLASCKMLWMYWGRTVYNFVNVWTSEWVSTIMILHGQNLKISAMWDASIGSTKKQWKKWQSHYKIRILLRTVAQACCGKSKSFLMVRIVSFWKSKNSKLLVFADWIWSYSKYLLKKKK